MERLGDPLEKGLDLCLQEVPAVMMTLALRVAVARGRRPVSGLVKGVYSLTKMRYSGVSVTPLEDPTGYSEVLNL